MGGFPWRRALVVIGLFGVFFLSVVGFGPQKRVCTFYSMGGILTEVQGYHTNSFAFRRACRGIVSFFEDTEAEISTYRSASVVSRLNTDVAKKKMILPERTFYLLKESAAISGLTGGYYDITVMPLVELWQEAGKSGRLPSAGEVREAVSMVSWKKVAISDEARREVTFLDPRVRLDFGAIGKGYLVDAAMDIMKKEGIPRGLVNSGGGVIAYDLRKTPEPFRIEIYDPDSDAGSPRIIPLLNESVQTSGDYNRFYTIAGKRFSHIVNPHTGYPGGTCHSITVRAATGLLADALSTAFCSMLAAGLTPLKESLKPLDPEGRVEILQLKR